MAGASNGTVKTEDKQEVPYGIRSFRDVAWLNAFFFLYIHIIGFYWLFFGPHKLTTVVFTLFYGTLGGLGITAGAHRLWAHRAYKATWQLRLFLALCNLIAFQSYIYEWVRDHRVHHKFSETHADPYNSKRGFWFSHIGWLLMRKHPEVGLRGKTVDMSDLNKDPIVVWQRKYYEILMPIMTLLLPVWILVYFLGEDFWTAWNSQVFRMLLSLHCTFLVNSAAHMWGNKPYDKNISPAENILVASLAYGEGWHNYHHVFPYDYKAAELGTYSLNTTTAFIDLCAMIGWAYDLKTVSEKTIRSRIARSGDGSHKVYGKEHHDDHHSSDKNYWGWGDKDMKPEDYEEVRVINNREE